MLGVGASDIEWTGGGETGAGGVPFASAATSLGAAALFLAEAGVGVPARTAAGLFCRCLTPPAPRRLAAIANSLYIACMGDMIVACRQVLMIGSVNSRVSPSSAHYGIFLPAHQFPNSTRTGKCAKTRPDRANDANDLPMENEVGTRYDSA